MGETFVPFVLFSSLRASKLEKMESENPLPSSSLYFLNHHAGSFPVVNGSISTHQNKNLPKAPQIFEGWLLPSQGESDEFSRAVIHEKKLCPSPTQKLNPYIIVSNRMFILSFGETLIARSIKSPSYTFVLRKHTLYELRNGEENCVRRAILTITLFLGKTQNSTHCFHTSCQPCIMFFFRDDTLLNPILFSS